MKTLRPWLIGLAAFATLALAAQAQVPGVNSTIQSVFNLVYEGSTMKPTYSASFSFTPAAAASDICVLGGSATKQVRVRRVILTGVSSAVWTEPVALIRRSTAPSGGTQALMTAAVYDTTNTLTNAANTATANPENFTANPTVGTFVSTLADIWVNFGNLTTGTGTGLNYVFGERGSALILRSATQYLAVNLNGITYTTPQFSCTFEWTEE